MCDDDFEVIVIEDGSSDFNQKEINDLGFGFGSTYLRTASKVSVGSSRTRNLGISKALGEVLIFLDCDMLVDENFVRNHYQLHQLQPFDEPCVQIGLRNMLFEGTRLSSAKEFENLVENKDFEKEVRHTIFEAYSENLANYESAWFYCFSNNLSVKKKTIVDFGSFDENFEGWGMEDCELGYRLSINGVRPVFNPSIEAYHQFHGQEFTKEKLHSFGLNLDYLCEKYRDIPTTLLRALFLHQEKYADEIDRNTRTKFVQRTREFFGAFEKSLRLYTESSVNSIREVVLKDPEIERVEAEVESLSKVTVVCSRSNLELISWVHRQRCGRRLSLFSY